MNKKICCIFNYAPHYRLPIYKKMDSELKCDFYFGDKERSPIKKLDYAQLNGFIKELKTGPILNTSFTWQKGVWPILFKKYNYYIITGDPYYLSNWVIILVGKIFGKKIIPWSHGIKGNSDNKMEWFEELFFKLCPLILLYGNHSRNVMIKKGFKPDKLVCIYNSLNYEKQLAVRNKLKSTNIYKGHFGNSNPIIIYIGRIQKSKNLELLVEITKELNDSGKPCNLVFIGKDVGDNDVVKTAEKLNILNKIWFYGPCYDEEKIGELIYNANVCVSPGPVGLTALHSLTYGTPIVSNDDFEGQMPEFEVIVPEKSGGFYIKDNNNDLKKKITYWLSISQEKREMTRSYCYKIIEENWNPKSQIKALKKIFLNETY